MRVFVLLTFFIPILTPPSFGQKVSLSLHDRPLKEALLALEEKTNYRFVPIGDVGERKVTVMLKEVSLHEILAHLSRSAKCSFLPFRRTFYVMPRLSPAELWGRLQNLSLPQRGIIATVKVMTRTSWGWQTTISRLHFFPPDRLSVETGETILWSEGGRERLWVKGKGYIQDVPSPLFDWVAIPLSAHSVPAFGYGWKRLLGWRPVQSEVALLLGRPVWVLELERRGSPPQRPTFVFRRPIVPGAIYVPYLEPTPIPWRIRCFLDRENLTLLRWEVYDPRLWLLRLVTATKVGQKEGLFIPTGFEVLDASMTVIAKGEWTRWRFTDEPPRPPRIPLNVLSPDSDPFQTLKRANRAWSERDEKGTAIKLAMRVVQGSDHPFALLEAAQLLASLGRPQRAWEAIEKMGRCIHKFPDALTLLFNLATSLGREREALKILNEQADEATPLSWFHIARLLERQGRSDKKHLSEALKWYGRILRGFQGAKSLSPSDASLLWDVIRRLFLLTWAFESWGGWKAFCSRMAETSLAPFAHALLMWTALEQGDFQAAKEHWRWIRENCPEWWALRLAMAEMAETYGLVGGVDREYYTIATQVPSFPEGKRALWHRLRRLVEEGKGDEAVRWWLKGLRLLRGEWTKCGWASEFRQLATLSLRHNLIAQAANRWRKKWVPERAWLDDLLAHFCEGEGDWEGALKELDRALARNEGDAFFAARWCQGALRAVQRYGTEKAQRKRAIRLLQDLDRRLMKWQRQFPDQPFFSLLSVFLPRLQSLYEVHPSKLRRLLRVHRLRGQRWLRRYAPPKGPYTRLVRALVPLNSPSDWLDRPRQIILALQDLARIEGEAWHPLRHIARQLLIGFSSFRLEGWFPSFVDEALQACWDETEMLAITQNALQVWIQRQRWGEIFQRLSRWLSGARSDFYRRSLLSAWRDLLSPFAQDPRSEKLLRWVLEQLPDDAVGWIFRAEALEVMGATDSAKEAYRKALEKSDADWVWQLFGEAAGRWGEWEIAEGASRKALEKKPTLERALFLLQAQMAQEKIPDPKEIRHWVLFFGWNWRLLAALAMGEPMSLASRHLRVAERLATFDPTVDPYRLFDLRLRLAQVALKVGDFRLARSILTRFLQEEAPPFFQDAAQELAKQLPP